MVNLFNILIKNHNYYTRATLVASMVSDPSRNLAISIKNTSRRSLRGLISSYSFISLS